MHLPDEGELLRELNQEYQTLEAGKMREDSEKNKISIGILTIIGSVTMYIKVAQN